MNMNKQIRDEIRILVRAQKKILRDCNDVIKIQKRQIKAAERAISQAQDCRSKQFERAAKRIAILQGRLS